MAGKVFFSVSMSLDGFIAPESLADLMGQQWMELQQWVFPQRFFRENLQLGEGGEEGRDNDVVRETFDQAREAAGDRDVRIAGGGATILEYVNAGLIDEFSIALSPVLFGSGIRLFEGVDAGRVALDLVRAEPSPRVTHLTYTVRER
jgi:hypothetical protein